MTTLFDDNACVEDLRRAAIDAEALLSRLGRTLEGSKELEPGFFELLRAAASCAREARTYAAKLVGHLDELAITDRRPA